MIHLPLNPTDLAEHGAALTLALTAGLAVWRLRAGQRWQTAAFVHAEIRRFEALREVRNALVILDEPSREIDFGGDVAGQRWGRVDRSTLIAALGTGGAAFPGWRVRDTFAVFFAELGRFEALIRAGLFSARDLAPFLSHRLAVLAGLAGGVDAPTRDALWQFLHRGGYHETLALMRRFGHKVALPQRGKAGAVPPHLVPRDSLIAARLLPRRGSDGRRR